MADLTKPFKKFTTHSAFRSYINSNMTIPDGIATCDEVPLVYAGGKQYGGMIYDIDSHTSEETNVLMGIINWTSTGSDTALSFKLKYGGVIYNPIKYSLQDSVVSITACKSSVSGDTLSFADFKHTMDDGWVITEFSLPLVNSGDGTKFLADDGSYKNLGNVYVCSSIDLDTTEGTITEEEYEKIYKCDILVLESQGLSIPSTYKANAGEEYGVIFVFVMHDMPNSVAVFTLTVNQTTYNIYHQEFPLLTSDSFKTINGESIVGEGNIDIAGGSQIYALQMARSITNTGTYNRLLLSQYNDGSLTVNAGDMLMLRRAATSTFNTSLPFSVYVNGTDVPVVDATNTAVTANHIVNPMPVGYYTFILSDDGKLVLQNPTLSAATVNTALEEIINQ